MDRLRFQPHMVTVALGVGAIILAVDAGVACVSTSPSEGNPVLQPRYVLESIDGAWLPANTLDASGASINVYADTLYFTTANQTYVEAARVGRFAGFPAESITVERRSPAAYTMPYSGNISLAMIGGAGSGSILGSASLAVFVTRSGVTKSVNWRYLNK